jgi:hypothetical protein
MSSDSSSSGFGGFFAAARSSALQALATHVPDAISSATSAGNSFSKWMEDPETKQKAVDLFDKTAQSLQSACSTAKTMVQESIVAAKATIKEQSEALDENTAAAKKSLFERIPELAVLADASAAVVQLARPLSLAAPDGKSLSTLELIHCARALGVLHRHCPHAFEDSSVASQPHSALPSIGQPSAALSATELARYSRYAHAVYGKKSVESALPFSADSDEDALMAYVFSSEPKPNKALLLKYCPQAEMCRPAYAVVSDMTNREIVVCIRGTASVSDVLTDVICETATHTECDTQMVAHKGMLTSALALDAEIQELLNDELLKNTGKIVLVGHSLGGGVASVLCELWHMRGTYPMVSACCFGAPCVLSLPFARSASVRVTSVVCDDDLVTRASLGSVGDLARALACLAHCSVDPANVQIDFQALLERCMNADDEPTPGDSDTVPVESKDGHISLSALTLKLSEELVKATPERALQIEQQFATIASAVHSFTSLHRQLHEGDDYHTQRLHAPGRLVHLRALTAGAQLCEDAHIDQLALGRVHLSETMLKAHAASHYVSSCARRISD